MNSSPPSPAQRLRMFAVSEIKGLVLAFWRLFWKVTLTLTMLLFVLLTFLIVRADPAAAAGQEGQGPPLALQLGCVFLFSLCYAIPVGFGAGLAAVAWRLCGWGILVPVFVIPLAVLLSVWICSGWLASEGGDALEALRQSAKTKGLPETMKAVEGVGKMAHGGGIEMLAVLAILLLPFLAIDAIAIMIDPAFLGQFAQFVFAVILAVCLGLIPSALFSLLLLTFTVFRRLKERYRTFS